MELLKSGLKKRMNLSEGTNYYSLNSIKIVNFHKKRVGQNKIYIG